MRRLLTLTLALVLVPCLLVAQVGTAIDNANRVQVLASYDHATKVTGYTLRIVRDGQTADAKAPYDIGKPGIDSAFRFFVCDASVSAINCPAATSVRVTGLFCDGLSDGAYRFAVVTHAGSASNAGAIFTGQYLRCGGVSPAAVSSVQKVG